MLVVIGDLVVPYSLSPRQTRLHSAGLVSPVIARRVERNAIFVVERGYGDYVRRLEARIVGHAKGRFVHRSAGFGGEGRSRLLPALAGRGSGTLCRAGAKDEA
ncbi:MAG: hypothetical protein HZB55_10755 [Deltaproteobacteria bacterium]|nr:hypothetical protein [Deltaproteobacteria bacterium]